MTPNISQDIPPPPEPPEDYECCNNGCGDLCVFEIYQLQKADYDKKYGNILDTPQSPSA